MDFTVISDTHGYHHKLKLGGGDVLTHAGDISKRGREDEVRDFLNWFSSQKYQYKIFIPGNHDFLFEEEPGKIYELLPDNVLCLIDKAAKINDVTVWGSPVTPRFYDWAFNRDPGDDIMQHWNKIPSDTDILITHGPAYSILDTTIFGNNVGCRDLLAKVQEVKPKFHIFGHIHESYGVEEKHGTQFINGSVLNEAYVVKNDPVRFSFKR